MVQGENQPDNKPHVSRTSLLRLLHTDYIHVSGLSLYICALYLFVKMYDHVGEVDSIAEDKEEYVGSEIVPAKLHSDGVTVGQLGLLFSKVYCM
mgnify:CR=1 FL=1